MKIAFIIFLAVVFVGCSREDPIDRIVKQDSADPHFPSGLVMAIRLPATAPVIEVTSNALGRSLTNITILETRQVHISGWEDDKLAPSEVFEYTAVLVSTSSGRKVVLLQFRQDKRYPPGGSWWNRVYDL